MLSSFLQTYRWTAGASGARGIVRSRPEHQDLVIVFVPKDESLLVTPGSHFIPKPGTPSAGREWTMPLTNEDPVECKWTGLPNGKATISSSQGLVFEFQERPARSGEDDVGPCVLGISFGGEHCAIRELQTVNCPSPKVLPGASAVSSSQSPMTLSLRTHDGRWAGIQLDWSAES